MPMTTTGDISLRTAGYISKKLLERAQPLMSYLSEDADPAAAVPFPLRAA